MTTKPSTQEVVLGKTNNDERKTVDYPKLPPREAESVAAKEYIEERFNNAIAWYDKEAGKTKKSYMRLRVLAVVGGALVPVLINIKITGFPDLSILSTIISLLVLLAVSVDSVFHYGEQWSSYRSTEQFLRREYYLFTVKEGPYKSLEKDSAFHLFVSRVEEAIAAENASTLRVLATVNDSKSAASSNVQQKDAAKKSKVDEDSTQATEEGNSN